MVGLFHNIKLTTVDIYLHTDTDTCMHICILTADYTVNPVQCSAKVAKTWGQMSQQP